MVFDPTYRVINMNEFNEWKWKYIFRYLNEDIPPNSLEEREKGVDLCGYVDSNQAGEKNTRRS